MKSIQLNGIHAHTGRYASPNIPWDALAAAAVRQPLLQRYRPARQKEGPFVRAFGQLALQITPDLEHAELIKTPDPIALEDLSEAGWGVLYPEQAGQPLLAALDPLLSLRRAQAGARYREMPYTPDLAFLDPQTTDLDQLPHYLLILGDPGQIPMDLHYALDRRLAVGRLALDHDEDYHRYANSVVRHEDRTVDQLRTTLYGTLHANDSPTVLTSQFLVRALGRRIQNTLDPTQHQVRIRLGERASKRTLAGLMGGATTPDFLITAAHGLILPERERTPHSRQGAIVTAEYPGPRQWRGGPPPRRMVFSHHDLPENAAFNGMVAFLYGCYSGGTPMESSFPLEPGGQAATAARQPFIARLPKAMLAAEDGCRAVIANMDTAFIWSFTNTKKQEQTQTYQRFIRDLLEGRRLGAAMNVFQQAYLERLADYKELVEAHNAGRPFEDDRLVQAWFAVNDLRNHIVLGDPAVRLPQIQP